MEMETEMWRALMHRLLDITMQLVEQGLLFRKPEEEDSDEESEKDDLVKDPSLAKGPFLGLVKLLSNFDPLLKHYLLSLKQGACESYLTPETQDELISALAKHAREKLAMDIKSAPYFALIFDSTYEISEIGQMAEVVRYVKVSKGKVEVKEAFLGFFPSGRKESAGLSSDILKNLERDGLDIMMCCAQCYVSNANRIGVQRGVEEAILAKNKKAIFNGCMEHSLNACACYSFGDNISWKIFFGPLELLLSFFAACPHRLDVLLGHTGGSLRKPSPTRWCTHHATVQLVTEKFDQVVLALRTLCEPQEMEETCSTAQCYLDNICDFTFLCYLYLWCDVLREVDVTQQSLQDIALEKVATKLEALGLFLHEERSHLVERAVEQALLKSDEYGISVEESDRYQKWRACKQESDAELPLQEENRREMLACIDRCSSDLQARARAIKEVTDRFEALQAKSLLSATEEELKVSVPKLTSFYDELSESELLKEILSLRGHLKEAEIDLAKAEDWAALKVLKFIAGWGFLESHPTLSRSLQLYLTVSVSPWETNLSKLSRVEGYLRSVMEQRGFHDSVPRDLALLSIESELVDRSDFEEVIDKLAALKAKKGKS